MIIPIVISYALVPIIQVKIYVIYIRWASQQFCIEQITWRFLGFCLRSAKQVSPIAVDGETTPAQVTTEGTGELKSMTQEVLFVWKLN